ncbi:MAG TPA: amidase [Trebonia sp.]|jgi:aspartyl-tRNA(Asn)/glutamyl-tRNA(Gln) amidotransferase subunit A
MTTLRELLAEHGGGTGLAAAVRAGMVSAELPTAAARAQIARRDAELHAFTQVTDRTARAVHGPLSGLPLAVKDNIDVAGTVTSLGRPLAGRPPARADAPAVAALVRAGAVVVGKTNLPEFATSAFTGNAAFGETVNPWDVSRTPGGSSGGSAVAVAAGLSVAALATDTAGSAVIPAALTGAWGLRPSYGAIPVGGVAPLSPSLDTVGLIAADARTLAAHHAVLAGRAWTPPGDDTGSLRGLRVAVLGGWFADADPDVAQAVAGFAHRLADHGCRLHTAELPEAERAFGQARAIYATEAAASIARLAPPGPRYAASVERRRTARYGTVEVTAARNARGPWRRAAWSLFADADVLLCPVTPMTAPGLGAGEDVTSRLVRLTYPFCFAGLPLVSVPGGWPGGLPAGVMLAGPPGGDDRLLRIATTIQDVGAAAGTSPPNPPAARSRAGSE